jgi:glycosyltransferase involved in cell wall biosynthesis
MIPDDVGVVAIGRNEGERLIGCLASAKTDTDNIVYVDSGSTDGSVAAAERMGAFVVK